MKRYLPVLLGGLTLMLFAAKPYLLDLVAPEPTVGEKIVEGTRDFVEDVESGSFDDSDMDSREMWTNVLTVSGFILFILAVILSIQAMYRSNGMLYGIFGLVLAIGGLVIYFME